MKSQKPKKPLFAARKRAFDRVLEAYRSAKDTNGSIGVILISRGGKGVTNRVRPTLTDFRCDCERVFNHCLRSTADKIRFRLAYLEFDSENPIEREIFADKVFGTGRHSLEQGIGALILKIGVYPLYGKNGYFHTVRQPRGSV
jgi:hypothetical protein